MYTIQDLLKHVSRLGSVCSSNDIKEKTPDLVEAFYQNRKHEETSFNTEINMRKQADKYIKEQELFLIKWVSFLQSPIHSTLLTASPVSKQESSHFEVGSEGRDYL